MIGFPILELRTTPPPTSQLCKMPPPIPGLIKSLLVTDRRTRNLLLHGAIKDGLYHVPASPRPQAFLTASSTLWHDRLDHPHSRVLRQILGDRFSTSRQPSLSSCPACAQGKATRLSLPSTARTSLRPLQLIFADVWGPAPMLSSNGHRYFLLFVDDYSHFSWVYPLANKSDVAFVFRSFLAYVE